MLVSSGGPLRVISSATIGLVDLPRIEVITRQNYCTSTQPHAALSFSVNITTYIIFPTGLHTIIAFSNPNPQDECIQR